MANNDRYILLTVITGVLFSITMIGAGLVSETEIRSTKILDSDTGKYKEKFYEASYVPEPYNNILLIIAIGGVLVITSMGILMWNDVRKIENG